MSLTLTEVLTETMGNNKVEQALMQAYVIGYSIAKVEKKGTKVKIEISFSPYQKARCVDINTSIKTEFPPEEELSRDIWEIIDLA